MHLYIYSVKDQQKINDLADEAPPPALYNIPISAGTLEYPIFKLPRIFEMAAVEPNSNAVGIDEEMEWINVLRMEVVLPTGEAHRRFIWTVKAGSIDEQWLREGYARSEWRACGESCLARNEIADLVNKLRPWQRQRFAGPYFRDHFPPVPYLLPNAMSGRTAEDTFLEKCIGANYGSWFCRWDRHADEYIVTRGVCGLERVRQDWDRRKENR